MKSRRTHYEILNVTSQSTLLEIKQAYKELLLNTHPDKIQSNNTHKINKIHSLDDIKEAYRVLGDDKLRKQYDTELLEDGKRKGIYKFGDGVDEVSLDTFETVEHTHNDGTESDIWHYYRKCPRCQVADGFKLDDNLLEEFAVVCENRDDGMYQVLIQCDSCSLWLKVQFFAADEEEQD
ncbi:similar to Saccharomyces cerevisiae YJR097W JJJ3 Protein of unknown function, contains a J-domain, which is a region with homology to the E. coli DnaJ protein [Maudiozyma saulgeensis]|uniref:Diphthamide biosynthesis protein 4 n=1 Tax=Maudiozyma saulgeensis TaxID=1789683 RepID=A0A1X7R5U3_9SACH|nr:similar to Saccharomyces cerevisiae YJR097W JJJ3 Protein of unknown function, contains a J-domain, which is a region with homology to the E. coli DnaJ protein [Kazachstania saulgeensis]